MFFFIGLLLSGASAAGQARLPGQMRPRELERSPGRIRPRELERSPGRIRPRELERSPGQARLQVQILGGYQQENLRWSIAGNAAGRDPNIYSELKWHGVGGMSAGAALSWEVWRRLVVFAEGSRMFTSSGSVSDTDYGADDRTDPVYGRSFESHKGYAYANIFGVGYRFLFRPRWELTPAVGYAWSGQRIFIGDAAESLNSIYRSWWKGLVVRASGEWKVDRKWGMLFAGEYHQANYRADADWNLIRAFSHPVSFSHRADGYGLEGRLGVKYNLGRHVAVMVVGDYFNWRTGKGVDELYLAAGPTSQTQLNAVVLTGFGIKGGLRVGW